MSFHIQKASRLIDMRGKIVLLLISALQITFSLQCKLSCTDDSQSCSPQLPHPCLSGGSSSGISDSVGTADILDRRHIDVAPPNHEGTPNLELLPPHIPREDLLGSPSRGIANLPPLRFPGTLSFVGRRGGAPSLPGPVFSSPDLNQVGPLRTPSGPIASPLEVSGMIRLAGPNSLVHLPGPGVPMAPHQERTCIRHALVPVPVQVVEECITNVPVIKKTIRHQQETITRHVPIFEKTVTQQEEKIVRQVPVARKTVRNVIETRIRHVPVIKSRSRTVVEPYTVHVPITERYSRPVEESITKTVPITTTRVRPVVVERTRLIRVAGRRRRPVLESRIHHVPIRRKYWRNVVEQRARPVLGPCRPCYDEAQQSTDFAPLEPSFRRVPTTSGSTFPVGRMISPAALDVSADGAEVESPHDRYRSDLSQSYLNVSDYSPLDSSHYPPTHSNVDRSDSDACYPPPPEC